MVLLGCQQARANHATALPRTDSEHTRRMRTVGELALEADLVGVDCFRLCSIQLIRRDEGLRVEGVCAIAPAVAGVDEVIIVSLEIDTDLAGDGSLVEPFAGCRIEIERIAGNRVGEGCSVCCEQFCVEIREPPGVARVSESAAKNELVGQVVAGIGVDSGTALHRAVHEQCCRLRALPR